MTRGDFILQRMLTRVLVKLVKKQKK